MHLFWLLIPAIYTYICVLGTLCTSEMLWRDHQHRLCCISSPWFTMVPIPLLVLPIDVQLLFVWREFNRLFRRCHKSNGKYIFSLYMLIFLIGNRTHNLLCLQLYAFAPASQLAWIQLILLEFNCEIRLTN